MTGQGLADGLEYTCSVLRRHNGLKHDWYYEKDGLWARAEPCGCASSTASTSTHAASHAASHGTGGQSASANTQGRADGTSAAVAATVSAATAATERAAAAATAANAAALATARSASAQPAASGTASTATASKAPEAAHVSTAAQDRLVAEQTLARERDAAAAATRPVAASTTRPVTSEQGLAYKDSAASVRRPPRDDEERGAPWVLWGSGAAIIALAGLFMYKGLTVKPAEKVEAAAVAPAAAPESKAVDEKPVAVAEAPAPAPEPAPAEDAPAATAEPESPPPATEPGATSFYGVSDPSRVMAWSSEATFNPDYDAAAPAAAPAAAEPEAAEAPAAVAESEPAPAAAEPEPEPYKTEPGQTAYYGIAEAADATQSWAAPATVYAEAEPAPAVAEAAPAEPEPVSEPYKTEPGQTSYYGIAETADATQLWAAPATVFAEAEPAPAPEPAAAEPAQAAAAEPEAEPYKTEPGVTSYYGLADKPDATQPWSAPATVFAEPEPEPAPAPAAAAAEPEPAAEPYKTEPGQTSYYGIAGQADATQKWAAPATVFAEPEPVASPAANACRDALTEALKAGTLNFATSKWDILSDSYTTLDEIAKQAMSCEGVKIEVGGHTDSTGSAAGNKTLSERRANAVMNYLIKAGVPASSITAVGYGQEKPIATNDTAAGKRQNRRIEFNVTSN